VKKVIAAEYCYEKNQTTIRLFAFQKHLHLLTQNYGLINLDEISHCHN